MTGRGEPNELSLRLLLLTLSAKGWVAKVLTPAVAILVLAIAYRVVAG